MATSRRRQSISVIDRLTSEPHNFEFFQAVRLLERAAVPEVNGAAELVAGSAPPEKEFVRFSAQTTFSYIGADINAVREDRNDIRHPDSGRRRKAPGGKESSADSSLEGTASVHQRWNMDVAFSGLTGSQGVMPYYLTDLVHRELRQNSAALQDFLDIFNHRHISLFYQAWHKYQLPVNYERHKTHRHRDQDLFSQVLASLTGLGTSEMRYRMSVPDEALYGMAGHLGRQQCSAAALASMIRNYFGLNVAIEQFQGQWEDLPEDVLTRLPDEAHPSGINNRLGRNTMLGRKCFQAQNKFQVVVEPMAYEDYMEIAPGSPKLEALKSFIQFSAGIEMDFELSVTLYTGQVGAAQLSSNDDEQPLLGWNTHMGTGKEHDQSVQITLSADQVSPDEALPAA
ncbi:type VI secretion system baseplate subunit TssG [Microbulbifer sp.]|uniref:type VI secretion system baseplate subunit TssG n=1 Tax=Microbulbifer sp. TaxID=1908541 RepID=UPI00258C730E|nr:type VI secretion system baseplate subunit TssG [Microbulbifer sp.]